MAAEDELISEWSLIPPIKLDDEPLVNEPFEGGKRDDKSEKE